MTRRPAARPPVLTGCCAVAEVKVAGDAIAEIEVGGRGRAAGWSRSTAEAALSTKATRCFPVAGK